MNCESHQGRQHKHKVRRLQGESSGEKDGDRACKKCLQACFFYAIVERLKKHVCGFCGMVPGYLPGSPGSVRSRRKMPGEFLAVSICGEAKPEDSSGEKPNKRRGKNMSVISMKQLLEAGVHFGHQTRRWNPKMAPYIYTERNGIYIIDLQKSVGKVDEAYKAVSDIAAEGGTILFVGTKKQAQGGYQG